MPKHGSKNKQDVHMEENKMAKYRKLGRTSDQRKALLRNQVTSLYIMEKLLQQKLKLKKSVRSLKVLIAMAVKEKDNFEDCYCNS